MRVGLVSYINALPLHLGLDLSQVNPILDTPARLNILMRKKKLDIALSSCIEHFSGGYELIPHFCIAAKKEILSVNLYTRVAVDQLTDVRIALSEQSHTSIALLKVLCHYFWKVKPRFERLDRSKPFDANDAFLLIGDEALSNQSLDGYQTIDLAAAWHQQTALPFVFAVFYAQRGVDYRGFQKQLADGLDWSLEHLDQVIEQAKKQSSLPEKLIRHYYSLCHYELGQKELEAMKLFNAYISKIDT